MIHQCSQDFFSKAVVVSEKFLKAFTLFHKCHELYDLSSLLSDTQITTLGKSNCTVNKKLCLKLNNRSLHQRICTILSYISSSYIYTKTTYTRGSHIALDKGCEFDEE